MRQILFAVFVLIAHALSLPLMSAPLTAADEDVLRMYDVSDLLMPVADFPAPVLGAHNQTGNFAASVAVNERPRVPPITADTFLKQHFSAEITALLRANCDLRESTLFLTATPTVHQHVERTLQTARNQQCLQVAMEISLFLMSPRLRQTRFSLPGVPWEPLADQPGIAAAELSAIDTKLAVSDQLNRAAEKNPEVTLETNPSLTTFAGQLANCYVGRQLEYHPVSMNRKPGVPATGQVNLGDSFAIRATPTSDRQLLTLKLEHKRCALIEMRTIDLGPAGKAEAPILWFGGEHLERTIAVGHSLIIATDVYLDSKEPRSGFLILTPTLIDVANAGAEAEAKRAEPQPKRVPTPARKTVPSAPDVPGVPKGANDF